MLAKSISHGVIQSNESTNERKLKNLNNDISLSSKDDIFLWDGK